MKNEISGYNKTRRDLFDEAFESFFRPTFFNVDDGAMKTDIREDKNGYTLDIEMPGYRKEDINVSLEDGYLTVSAKKEEKENDDKSVYLRRERSVSCSRSYYVGDVEEDDVKAKFDGGVLTLVLPKEKQELVSPHTIKID